MKPMMKMLNTHRVSWVGPKDAKKKSDFGNLEILDNLKIWLGAHTWILRHGSHLSSLGPPRLNCSKKSLLFLVHCSWHWILRFHITAGQNKSSPLSTALIRFAVCSVLLLRDDFTTGMGGGLSLTNGHGHGKNHGFTIVVTVILIKLHILNDFLLWN